MEVLWQDEGRSVGAQVCVAARRGRWEGGGRERLSDSGLHLWWLVLLQQAIGGLALGRPLEGVGQQLGHAVVQLQGRPR